MSSTISLYANHLYFHLQIPTRVYTRHYQFSFSLFFQTSYWNLIYQNSTSNTTIQLNFRFLYNNILKKKKKKERHPYRSLRGNARQYYRPPNRNTSPHGRSFTGSMIRLRSSGATSTHFPSNSFSTQVISWYIAAFALFFPRYINRHRIFHTVFLSILALIVPLAIVKKGARTGRAGSEEKKEGGKGRREGRGLDEEQQQGDE